MPPYQNSPIITVINKIEMFFGGERSFSFCPSFSLSFYHFLFSISISTSLSTPLFTSHSPLSTHYVPVLRNRRQNFYMSLESYGECCKCENIWQYHCSTKQTFSICGNYPLLFVTSKHQFDSIFFLLGSVWFSIPDICDIWRWQFLCMNSIHLNIPTYPRMNGCY